MSYRGLTEKVVMVTGGGAGIGAACATRLAGEGMRVVVVDCDGDAAAQIASVLPTPAVAVAADVSSEADVMRAVQAAVVQFGRLDAAVLNAGIGGDMGPLTSSSTANFDRVFAVDVRGCYLSLRTVLQQMLAQDQAGSIVVTASTLSLTGGPMYATYTAAKHAILGLVRSVALEVARAGIRVNAVCPGYVDTQLMRSAEDAFGVERAAARASMEATVPLGRYGHSDEMAAMAAWLLSEDARYATGAAFTVDGGISAGSFVGSTGERERPSFAGYHDSVHPPDGRGASPQERGEHI